MIDWDNGLQLGHDAIDQQHRRMVMLANRVYRAHGAAMGEGLAEELQALITASAEHFRFEERLMAESGYERTGVHSEHHAGVLGELERFAAHVLAGRHTPSSEKLLAFLKSWITSHITLFDRELAEHLARRN